MGKEVRSLGERVSDAVAHFGGSWKFIISACLILLAWISYNKITDSPFDPYPFILLNLLLSLVAAFQAPFILMSQHRAEKKQDVAYRQLFEQIRVLVEKDIELEEQILELLRELYKRTPNG